MKKLLSIILAILMVVATMPMAFAGSNDYTSDEYEVTFSADNKTLIKFDQKASYIESYVIPEGVTEIASNAFYKVNIGTIVLPSSLETLGSEMVGDGDPFANSKFKQIVILDGIEALDPWSFSSCMIEEVIVPSSVKKINMGAFWNCGPLSDPHYLGSKDDVSISSEHNDAFVDNIHYCTEKDVVAETCTEDGYQAGWYCDDCEKYIVGGEAIPASHDIIIDEAVAPKCGETGLTAGQHCSRCDDMTVAQEVIPALGHADEDGDNICDNGCGTLISSGGDGGTGEPETPDEPAEDTCDRCGLVHTNVFQKLICLLMDLMNRVLDMLKGIFI